MNISSLFRPQSLMLAAYVFGQGLYFFVIGVLLIRGESGRAADIGFAFMLISLGIQLGDLGNPAVLVKLMREKEVERAIAFLVARSVVGFVVGSVVFAGLYLYSDSSVVREVAVLMPAYCALGASMPSAILEARRKYASLAVLSVSSWVLPIALVLFVPYAAERPSVVLVFSFIVLAVGAAVCFRHVFAYLRPINAPLQVLKSIFQVAGLSLPLLIGQLWARYVAGLVLLHFGPSAFNSLNLARGVLTGWIMISSTWVRASHTSRMVTTPLSSCDKVIDDDVRAPIALALLVLGGCLIVWLFGPQAFYIPVGLRESISLFSVLAPLGLIWIFQYRAQLSAQSNFSIGRVTVLELASFVPMVFMFFLVWKWSLGVALLLSDAGKAFAFIAMREIFLVRAARQRNKFV